MVNLRITKTQKEQEIIWIQRRSIIAERSWSATSRTSNIKSACTNKDTRVDTLEDRAYFRWILWSGAINGQAHHERHERRLFLKERSAPYHYSTQEYQTGEDASDHALSSWIRRPFATNTGAVYNVDVNTTPTFIDVHMSVHHGHQRLTR